MLKHSLVAPKLFHFAMVLGFLFLKAKEQGEVKRRRDMFGENIMRFLYEKKKRVEGVFCEYCVDQ